MKPDFALSLSHDGISLLHRQDGGWIPVGSVPLDSADLAVALADLRQSGRARAGGPLTSTIIVPSDQIRFLALPGAKADDATVRAALDGSTPYPVNDLVYDFRSVAGTLHIAAVARETLAEAEAFAADHGFGPVSFQSEAQATGFPVGAFFGPSRIAARLIPPGETVERDIAPDEDDDIVSAADVAAADGSPSDGQPDHMPDPVPDAPADPEPQSDGAVEPADDTTLPVADAETAEDGDAGSTTADAPPAQPDLPPESDASPEPETPPLVFASRARPLRAVTEPPPVPAPAPLMSQPDAAAEPESAAPPVFAHRRRAEPAVAPQAPVVFGRADADQAQVAPQPPAEDTNPPPADAADETDAAPPPLPVETPAAPPPATPTPRATKGDVPPLVAKRLAAPAWAQAALANPTPKPAAKAPSQKQPAKTAAKPAAGPAVAAGAVARTGLRLRLGLVLTGVLLFLLALIALWSTTLGSGLASLFGGTDPAAAIAQADPAAAAPDAATQPVQTAAAPAGLPGEVPADPLDTADVAAAAAAVATGFVTPDEADRIYAATGVWLRAPRLPLMPETDDLDSALTGGRDSAPADAAIAALPTGPGMAPDASLPTQPVPPGAGTSFPRDARGLIIASPEGTLLPNGATVFAAAPPLVPPTRPGTPPPAPDAVAAEAVATLGIRPALRPAAVLAAAVAAGLATDPTADAEAEAEATTIPLEGTPAGTTPGAVAYDGLRPAVRPDYMVPPEPWDGPAPPNRPAGLAPEDAVAPPVDAAEEPPADDLDATLLAIVAGAPDPLAGVTEQAVPQARRPDARPRNFDSVVQTQTERLARAQQQQEQAATEQVAAAAPAPDPVPQTGGTGTGALSQEEAAEAAPEIGGGESLPVAALPGSVAQNATIADAINLREVNVIGVFGSQSNRRALVRLANGRILQVRVGDTLDGGQVTAIGDSFVNYAVRGQTVTLRVPG